MDSLLNNHLEKLICVELLEKISRMQRYLLSEPDVSRHQSKEVSGIFLKALDGILDDLTSFVEKLSNDLKLGEYEKIAIIRRFESVFNSVDALHAQLKYIYGTWVRPESHIFIENVLYFIPTERRPRKVNIVLSNRYSFEEGDFSAYLKGILNEIGMPVDIQSKIPILFMPKIEWDNPLNWAILAHECGHIDRAGIQKTIQLLSTINIDSKEMIERWAEEIYCDIFAANILGPAYLASFTTFALLKNRAGESDTHTQTHPADIIRLSVMQEIFKKNKIKVAISKSKLSHANDVSSFFNNILEERIELDRRGWPTYTHKPPVPPFVLQQFVDKIYDEVDKIANLNQQLTLKDFSRIKYLSEKRLSKGITIGSYRNHDLAEEFKKHLSSKEFCEKDLDAAKMAAQESRTLIWEIINTGWLHKIENVYPRAIEMFFSKKGKKLKEKLKEWDVELKSIDRLLLKSIESSEIQRLMEEKDGTIRQRDSSSVVE